MNIYQFMATVAVLFLLKIISDALYKMVDEYNQLLSSLNFIENRLLAINDTLDKMRYDYNMHNDSSVS